MNRYNRYSLLHEGHFAILSSPGHVAHAAATPPLTRSLTLLSRGAI